MQSVCILVLRKCKRNVNCEDSVYCLLLHVYWSMATVVLKVCSLLALLRFCLGTLRMRACHSSQPFNNNVVCPPLLLLQMRMRQNVLENGHNYDSIEDIVAKGWAYRSC
jgi:hypothetical protein